MIQINPERMIRIELTPKEQKTILTHCQNVDKNIYDRIKNVRNGVLHLLVEDCYYFKEYIHAAIQTAKKPKVQNILGNVFNKISPNPITRSIAKEIEGQDFDNIDDLNDHLKGMMSDHNTAPDSEMGGLSSEQVGRLICLSWDDNKFPLKFNKELTYSDIKNSIFYKNSVIFLKTLIEQKNEPTATAKGNLNRKFVKHIFDKLIIKEDHKDSILEYNKVINEEDVFPLHIVRIVCECAGLIHKRKNKFLVLKKYYELLQKEKAGELYYLLFHSYFTKFNLSYLDRLPDLVCIQETIAYSINRLGEIADSWVGIEDLFDKIFLPAVRLEIRETVSKHIKLEWVVRSRVVKPLEEFGLVECRYKEKGDSEIEKVRKSELFDRFVGVEW